MNLIGLLQSVEQGLKPWWLVIGSKIDFLTGVMTIVHMHFDELIMGKDHGEIWWWWKLTCKMTNKLKNPQNAHHSHLWQSLWPVSLKIKRTVPNADQLWSLSVFNSSHQSNDLASLANDGEVLKPLQDEGDVEGADRHKVDQVHRLLHKPGKEPEPKYCLHHWTPISTPFFDYFGSNISIKVEMFSKYSKTKESALKYSIPVECGELS